MRNRASEHSAILAARDQVSSDVGDEVVVVDLEAGIYYGLEEVKHRTESVIRDAILLDIELLRSFGQGRHR